MHRLGPPARMGFLTRKEIEAVDVELRSHPSLAERHEFFRRHRNVLEDRGALFERPALAPFPHTKPQLVALGHDGDQHSLEGFVVFFRNPSCVFQGHDATLRVHTWTISGGTAPDAVSPAVNR